MQEHMAPLKIHLYTICWNEERMLPHFLAYYSGFCEKIVVYDNFSTDRSVEICKRFSNVDIRQYLTSGTIRDDLYQQIKNECWKQSKGIADWVIVCDIDEFLYHPDLTSFLTLSKANNISIFKPKGYNMITKEFPLPNENLLKRVQYGSRSISFDKCAIFDPNKIEEINYEAGAHQCLPIGKLVFSQDEILLLHYKYMELNYLIQRYHLLASRLSSYNKKYKLSFHYTFSERKIKREFEDVWKNREQVIDSIP